MITVENSMLVQLLGAPYLVVASRQRGDEVRDGDSRAASLCRTSDHRTVRRLGSREAHARSAAAGDERTRLDGAVRLEQRGDMGAGR